MVSEYIKKAVVSGLCFGLVLAVLDPLLASIFHWERVALPKQYETVYLLETLPFLLYPLAGAIIGSLLALAFKKSRQPSGYVNFVLAVIVVWLLLMSGERPLSMKAFLLFGSINGLFSVFAGFGIAVVLSRIEAPSPGRTLALAIVSYMVVVGSMNLVYVAFPAMGSGLTVIKTLIIALLLAAIIFVFIRTFRIAKRGGSKLVPVAAVPIAVILLLLPAISWRSDYEFPPRPAKVSPEAPHVIFILSDALRADAISAERTPNIVSLMRRGTNFTEAQTTASWTLPAICGLFTGRSPAWFHTYWLGYEVPGDVPMLAEDFYSMGYSTYLYTANGLVSENSGLTRGFEVHKHMSHAYQIGNLVLLPVFATLDNYVRRGLDLAVFPDRTPRITDYAIDAITENEGRPVYMYLHYMDPHDPLNPPDDFAPRQGKSRIRRPFNPNHGWHVEGDRGEPQLKDIRLGLEDLSPDDIRFIKGLYLGEVAYLDREMGRLLDLVKDGTAPDGRPVIVVFTSDHGEELWDHGDYSHGHQLFQEMVHVPLVFAGPGIDSIEVNEPVSHVSVAPTLRELIGLPKDEGAEGRSLMPCLAGKDECVERTNIYSSEVIYYNHRAAVRRGDDKIIHDLETNGMDYYNLASDPLERSPEDPAEVPGKADLGRDLVAHEIETGMEGAEVDRDKMSPELEKKLRAMGYIQ